MDLQFEDELDSKVYIQWTQALLPAFGERPYDVVFVDGGGYEDMWHDLRRLAGQAGVVVDKEPLRAEVEKLVEPLETTSLRGEKEVERVNAQVERRYEAAVGNGLVAL